jgi:hypothetical protein
MANDATAEIPEGDAHSPRRNRSSGSRMPVQGATPPEGRSAGAPQDARKRQGYVSRVLPT